MEEVSSAIEQATWRTQSAGFIHRICYMTYEIYSKAHQVCSLTKKATFIAHSACFRKHTLCWGSGRWLFGGSAMLSFCRAAARRGGSCIFLNIFFVILLGVSRSPFWKSSLATYGQAADPKGANCSLLARICQMCSSLPHVLSPKPQKKSPDRRTPLVVSFLAHTLNVSTFDPSDGPSCRKASHKSMGILKNPF